MELHEGQFMLEQSSYSSLVTGNVVILFEAEDTCCPRNRYEGVITDVKTKL